MTDGARLRGGSVAPILGVLPSADDPLAALNAAAAAAEKEEERLMRRGPSPEEAEDAAADESGASSGIGTALLGRLPFTPPPRKATANSATTGVWSEVLREGMDT